jgi:hypothetical protein
LNWIANGLEILEISTICPIYQLIIFLLRSHYAN